MKSAVLPGAVFCRLRHQAHWRGLALTSLPAFAAGGATTTLTADEALAKLKAGNDKYVSGPELCAVQLSAQREHVSKSQAPWATIVSCADSRVPPELLFGGLGVGELFVARNAGNMVDTATMAPLNTARVCWRTTHYCVGARTLWCRGGRLRSGGIRRPSFRPPLAPMVNAIVPAARAVKGKPGDFVDNAVRESAIRTAKQIASKSTIVAGLIKKGKVKVLAGRYDLDEGKVEYFA
jgi:carbonic anhydrase